MKILLSGGNNPRIRATTGPAGTGQAQTGTHALLTFPTLVEDVPLPGLSPTARSTTARGRGTTAPLWRRPQLIVTVLFGGNPILFGLDEPGVAMPRTAGR